MKVYYFNDEKKSVRVFLNTLEKIAADLPSGTGMLFDFDAPENSVPFVKKWSYQTVLISYLPLDPMKQKNSSEQGG